MSHQTDYQNTPITTGGESSYQLSPIQQGMLFDSLSGQQPGVDIEQAICSIRENLNVSVVIKAWQQIVQRHPILRTSFSWLGKEFPLQTVHQQVELPSVEQDWRNLSEGDRANQLETYLQADRLQGFDLTQPPLMRLACFRVAETEYKLIWTYHHILLDSTSAIIVLQEVFTLYEALCADRPLELKPPRCDRDCIEWMQQQDISKAETFWRQYLSGFSAPTPLVGDFSRAAQMPAPPENYLSAAPEIRLSSTVTAALNSLIQEHQLTLNTLLQSAWALLLSRCSGSEDVVFGAICNSRPQALENAESAVGLLINTLPVRVVVSPDLSAIDWIKQLQIQWAKLQEYGYAPLAKTQEWSEISRGRSLFESLLVVENCQINSALQALGDNGQNREFQLLEQTSFPLTVYAYGGAEFLLKIAGDRDRFDPIAIPRMLGHLQTLLESIAANPQQKISKLSMLTAAELAQLQEWNQTQANYPQDKCVHQLFEAQVERSPETIAAVFSQNLQWFDFAHQPQQLTYRELNSKANQLAHYLQQLGVGPDVLVAICMERSLEIAIAVLGVLKAGAAYVPLDPAYPKERLTFMLADTQAPVILTQSHLVSELPAHQARAVCLDADWETISSHSTENPASSVSPQNLTYTIYTSGSTGKPKGVPLPHRALVNLIAWQLQNSTLEGPAKTLQFASLSFDVSFQEMFCTWCAGGTLVFITEEIRRDAQTLLQLIDKEKIQRLFLPFIALQHLAEAADTYQLVPKSLREVVTAGEQLQVNRYIASFFQQLENCTLHNQYGPSESHVVTAYTLSGPPGDWPALPPIGRPIANTHIYLLQKDGQPIPLGVAGELYIGGICLARGYLNRPDLTAEKFIPNPFKHNEISAIEDEEDRLYKTGDLARYQADGNIEYIGRIDGQVKIRGFRIELGEIETALAKHRAVKQAVVLAREDTPGDKRLVAYVVANPEEQLAIADLRSYLQGKLPDYMVPAIFMTVEAMPKTPSGKIDRRALPAPDSQRQEQSQSYAAPQSELERLLAGVWSKLLKIDRVGIHDNFFEIGGNSLMTLQVAVQVRELLGTDLPIVKLFQHPTIAQLANYLNEGQSAIPSNNKFQDRADRQKAAFNRRKQSTKRS